MTRRGILHARRRHSTVGVAPPSLSVAPYFHAYSPTSGESGSYNRNPYLFFWTVPTFTWVWRFQEGWAASVWPSARALVDGVPATPWISPATNDYPFVLTPGNGHHVLNVEFQSRDPSIEVRNDLVIARDFIVNTTGAPLPTQAPWTCISVFDRTYARLPNGQLQKTYPGSLPTPTARPLKARTIEPYNTILPFSQLWVRRIQANNHKEYTRRFVAVPTGDVAIEPDQKYTYNDSVGAGVGLSPPRLTLRDGPRHVGTLGAQFKAVVRSGGSGYYLSDTNGRLIHMSNEGTVTTIIGWRVKPGMLKAHASILHTHYMYGPSSTNYKPDHVAFYNSRFEHLGNWQTAGGPSKTQEMRGFALAKRRPDGSIDVRDGREFWVCDALHDRILYVNARTADSVGDYEAPHFPAAGYTAPSAPTGSADVSLFCELAAGDEPFDAAVNPADGKLYWVCYGSGRIMRCNLNGSSMETVLATVYNPTNAQLSAPMRLSGVGGIPAMTAVRNSYLIDGPRGTATCVRPQSIGFTSMGKLIWAERYTYAVRQLDLTTGIVTTLALIPVPGFGFGTEDVGMCIDVEGTCGPQDDIFVNCYHYLDYRFSSTGVARGRWMYKGGYLYQTTGAHNTTAVPGYSIAVGVGNGKIITVGSAAGYQCIEITKKQPSDTAVSINAFDPGYEAFYNDKEDSEIAAGQYSLVLEHGPMGQGELGAPNIEDLGAMSDAALDAYALSKGVPADRLASLRTFVRSETAHLDYS